MRQKYDELCCVDRTACAKNFYCVFLSLAGLGYYWSNMSLCEHDQGVSSGKSFYALWDPVNGCSDEKAVHNAAYVACWTILLILSLLNFAVVTFGARMFNMIFGVCMFISWVWLAIMDLITLRQIFGFFDGDAAQQQLGSALAENLKTYWGFQISLFLVAESFIFVNTAWDTFDTSDTREVKQPDHLIK